jgi:ribonuclease HII
VAGFKHTRPDSLQAVDDSKKVPEAAREMLARVIVQEADFIDFGFATSKRVDDFGMAEAWLTACDMALRHVPDAELLIIDGDRDVRGYKGKTKVQPKADAKYWQVGAASIVAKVTRDAEMQSLGKHFPQYDWKNNKGYGTKKHYEGLNTHGPCPLHRELFLRKWRRKKIHDKHRAMRGITP